MLWNGRSLRWVLAALMKNELVLSLIDCLFFVFVLVILILCTQCTPYGSGGGAGKAAAGTTAVSGIS